jgi:hypothetical protein
MRNFAFVPEEFIQDDYTPQFVEGNPVYQGTAYDSIMLEEVEEGKFQCMDMTSILLNQEKYRRLLGDMNVNNILAQMHPTQSTVMDDMTDEERFACVISRHCQTMSERQAVLSELASQHSELTELAKSMLAEQSAEPAPNASAPAPSA